MAIPRRISFLEELRSQGMANLHSSGIEEYEIYSSGSSGNFEEWAIPKILKIPPKFEKKSKKNQHWIYISKFGMFGNNTKNWSVFLKNRNKTEKFWQIAENFLIFSFLKCSKRKFGIFEVLGKFWRGIEEPRSYKIYSSGNRGVKKGPGPRGSRDEEFLVPSLIV